MNRDKEVGPALLGDRGSILQRHELVVGSRHKRFDLRARREQLVKPFRDVEHDLLLLDAVRAHGAGVLSPVAGIDYDPHGRGCGGRGRGAGRFGREPGEQLFSDSGVVATAGSTRQFLGELGLAFECGPFGVGVGAGGDHLRVSLDTTLPVGSKLSKLARLLEAFVARRGSFRETTDRGDGVRLIGDRQGAEQEQGAETASRNRCPRHLARTVAQGLGDVNV